MPITYSLPSIQGIAFLVALYVGGISGGLIAAILIRIPGTPSSVATVFDGYPMAQKGEAARALGIGTLYSFFGGSISGIAMLLISPILASFAIYFGYPEYFAIAVFSLTLIATVSEGSMAKGIFAGLLGLLVAAVG